MSESNLEYKKRMVDTISESYCGAKWYNATIWLGHGETTSCHHPPSHAIDVEEIKTNPSAIHNTPHKKKMRKMMHEGIRPNECEYCWKVEDMGKDHISDRVMKTKTVSDEKNKEAATLPWDADVDLTTLEISFNRTCNFACSYCSPTFSTTWVKDIKKNGSYKNIVSDGRNHYATTADYAKNAGETEDDNPYIQAFWKWWEKSLQYNLDELRITGGEPLMSDSVWKLFDWFKDNKPLSNRMRYAINSNLVPKKALMDRLIVASQGVENFTLYTSQESVGKHAEYIRDGMKYDEWLSNVERLIVEGNVKHIVCMSTINGLCLASLVEFLDMLKPIKRKYGQEFMTISLNILRFPSFQSCAILPENIKDLYRTKLQNWLDIANKQMLTDLDCKNRPIFNEWEMNQVERLIDYLVIVKTPTANTAEIPKLYNDFKQFYIQYDERRGKNFRETFPQEFVDFIDSIPDVMEDRVNIIASDNEANILSKEGSGYVSDELTDKNKDHSDGHFTDEELAKGNT